MKKLLLATTAVVALTGSAFAADLPARTYTKAPPPVVAPSWTGFYIFGGGGGGLWNSDQHTIDTPTNTVLSIDNRTGGSGWFGTVGAGYDWQINQSWVFGILADGQFGSIRGDLNDTVNGFTGFEKLQDQWAAGVRLGYLVAPNVLSYVNGGYAGAHFSGTTLVSSVTGGATGFHTDSFNRNGWFIGGGVENNLNIFGITSPGWFMKTEYRSSFYDQRTINELVDGTNLSNGFSVRANNWNQTISTSLVYRFNWSGPVVAKY